MKYRLITGDEGLKMRQNGTLHSSSTVMRYMIIGPDINGRLCVCAASDWPNDMQEKVDRLNNEYTNLEG